MTNDKSFKLIPYFFAELYSIGQNEMMTPTNLIGGWDNIRNIVCCFMLIMGPLVFKIIRHTLLCIRLRYVFNEKIMYTYLQHKTYMTLESKSSSKTVVIGHKPIAFLDNNTYVIFI